MRRLRALAWPSDKPAQRQLALIDPVIQPLVQGVDGRVAGEIDMQGRNRDITGAHRIKISARAGFLFRAGGADPVNGSATRIKAFHHRFGFVPMPKPGGLDAGQRFPGAVGDIDVEDDVGRQGVFLQAAHQPDRDPGRSSEMLGLE